MTTLKDSLAGPMIKFPVTFLEVAEKNREKYSDLSGDSPKKFPMRIMSKQGMMTRIKVKRS